jgi:hypothetical protein
LKQLIPILQILGDFFEVVAHDDAKDIGLFATATHSSHFHHYQWGAIGNSLCNTAIGLIEFANKALAQENETNRRLKEIINKQNQIDLFEFIAQEVRRNKAARQQYDDERIKKLLDYMNYVNNAKPGEAKREVLYMGDLNRIRVQPRNYRVVPIDRRAMQNMVQPALPAKIYPRPKRLSLPN